MKALCRNVCASRLTRIGHRPLAERKRVIVRRSSANGFDLHPDVQAKPFAREGDTYFFAKK